MKNKILTPNTIKALRWIKRQVLKEPRQFQMANFFENDLEEIEIPNCGTAACIGAWGICYVKHINPKQAMKRIVRAEKRKNWGAGNPNIAWKRGQSAIGLSDRQSELLFKFECWPKQFRRLKRQGTLPYAQQAARRIDHFIKTDGAE